MYSEIEHIERESTEITGPGQTKSAAKHLTSKSKNGIMYTVEKNKNKDH